MNERVAYGLIDAELRRLRQLPYPELINLVGTPETKHVVGQDGKSYQFDIEALWDSPRVGDVRVIVAADDGGWRAFKLLTSDFIMRPDGSLVSGSLGYCYNDKSARRLFRSGCLVSVAALVSAVVLYPRARWLFVLVPIGIALVVLSSRFVKNPTPQAVADDIERRLSGTYGGWEVDDYEHLNPRDPEMRELWHRSMEVGGLPEEWVRLNEKKKTQMQDIVRNLRQLGVGRR